MTDEQWYWDLVKGCAVPASQRGKADNVLGPYATMEEAEHWKDRVEARNEAWKEADEAWSGEDDDEESDEA
jgi:hypothetical protein